ncbi:Uncharacterised protein [Bordetella pertussis]|nr:Uncharacterised protein [Bordetella pertussis]
MRSVQTGWKTPVRATRNSSWRAMPDISTQASRTTNGGAGFGIKLR